jgi:hypothetical protein
LFLDHAQRFDSVSRLAGDFHAIELPEQKAQLLARQLLVVHHDRSERVQPVHNS